MVCVHHKENTVSGVDVYMPENKIGLSSTSIFKFSASTREKKSLLNCKFHIQVLVFAKVLNQIV